LTEILAIIPARGGSKSIPHKNIYPLAGKPLLAYSIEHARQTPAITRIVVSTDDPQIGAVAQEHGAEVIWRPAEISGDFAASEAALTHVLDSLQEKEGYEPDLIVFLQATSPLRQPDDIQNAIDMLAREQADSLLSVYSMHVFIWREQNGEASSFSYDYRNRRMRQNAPEDLVENGSIYIFKPWVLRQLNNRLGGKIALYRMKALDSIQIDEPHDMTMIEMLLAMRRPAVPNLSGVALLALDFDGVMTDNRVLVDQNGDEAVWCNRGDGWGIARLKEAGIPVVVISTEVNPVVAARCRKLGIDYRQGLGAKLAALQAVVQAHGLTPGQVAYVGNDVNDLACLSWVGWPVAVADAVEEVRRCARWVTSKNGGAGAVREVADLLLEKRN
jgi:YrbI family 3-deoxy-D-manno-octulosonate 8-phosphate phosphatase